jgi:hypothetical protein
MRVVMRLVERRATCLRAVRACALSAVLTGCSSGIPADADLRWQYDHSTDVGRFLVVNVTPLGLPNQTCELIVWDLNTLESFKGPLTGGQMVQVWGPSDPKQWRIGEERLMFLRQYDGNSYDDCSKRLFEGYKQVHWSCCEIKGSGGDATVLFESMLNSEARGPDIPVDAAVVFAELRSFD